MRKRSTYIFEIKISWNSNNHSIQGRQLRGWRTPKIGVNKNWLFKSITCGISPVEICHVEPLPQGFGLKFCCVKLIIRNKKMVWGWKISAEIPAKKKQGSHVFWVRYPLLSQLLLKLRLCSIKSKRTLTIFRESSKTFLCGRPLCISI